MNLHEFILIGCMVSATIQGVYIYIKLKKQNK